MRSKLLRNTSVFGTAIILAGCQTGSSDTVAPAKTGATKGVTTPGKATAGATKTGTTKPGVPKPAAAPKLVSATTQKSYTGQPVKPPKGMGNVQGRVLFDGKGASDIEVTLCEDISFIGACKGKSYTAKTNDEGNYVIDNVPPGDYSLAVRVFNTTAVVFPSTGLLSAPRYTVAADKTLDVPVTNLFKTDLKVASPKAGENLKTGSPKLTWEAYPDAKTYEVTLKTKGAGLEPSVLKTSSTTIALPSPLFNGTYEWKVEAKNAAGTKIAETPEYVGFNVEGQTGSATVKLVAPEAASVVPGANIKLTWEAQSAATGYQVYLRSVSSSIPEVSYEDVKTNEYTVKKPLASGQYFWTVIATRNGRKIAAAPIQAFKVQ